MPLRDHFRPPLDDVASWEGFHGGWPMVIVQHLRKKLPPGYAAEPRVHLGTRVEVDVATFEADEFQATADVRSGVGGVAMAVWAPAAPSVAVETELPDYDEYEVRIYDVQRHRRLVAAIEIVSPRNKDRPESRNAFIAKCAAMIQQGIAVSMVDLVTVRQFNLYTELMSFIGHRDLTLGTPPPAMYAASCRWIRRGERAILETWSHALALGQRLPILPLWLSETCVLPLDLEASYEQACDDLSLIR